MGRRFTEPEVKDLGGYEWVITRVNDPDDEFAETQVLCEEYDRRTESYGDLGWRDYGSAAYGYDAVRFLKRPDAERFLRGLLFGRDSVSVERSL